MELCRMDSSHLEPTEPVLVPGAWYPVLGARQEGPDTRAPVYSLPAATLTLSSRVNFGARQNCTLCRARPAWGAVCGSAF